MNHKENPMKDLDANIFYQIVQTFWEMKSWRESANQLVKMIRPYFIFDNLVVYLLDPMNLTLEAAFAKATGRGKSAEADVAWGEIIAARVIESRQIVLQEPEEADPLNRLKQPYTLALPLATPSQVFGALVFIRFGSPPYSAEQIKFAHMIARLLSRQIQYEYLKRDHDHLEFQYRVFQVQEDFISTVSHELRTPLGFIKGYTTTLLRTDANWDEKTQREFLSIIDNETDRLQDLIANLLDSAKLQAGQIVMNFQQVRLESLVNDLLTRLALHHPGLVIHTDIEQPLKPIQADPRRLVQVFENLLTNAEKYAPASPVYITIRSIKNGVKVDIRDEGPGIPEKYQERIFDRFFRVPDQQTNVHGSGLGLFICRQIIQAHHGEITLTSKVGEGTTFHIILPETIE
ncbi:histidine kinase [Bellilinea caldifistulae]|uniref:GAF domain-containing sensor histidine kinase n=1 Tax=Bellilinea caldifistulae TaxID=360411 RepID=UPI000780C135|nr:ATP-binding protein [Bellilinea caldifistulae]GAP10149.1 histidine kinase [Bellilinea caldifistulae]